MRALIRKYGALFLALVLICGVCLFFAARKSGMFIDEIFTYGLSNSHYAPFLGDIHGDLDNTVLTREELLDYLVVGPEERFDFASVYYNQTRDVHPPLYYWLLNAVCSLTPGSFSLWSGLILDLLLYLLTAVLLYRLVLRLFGSRLNAAAAAALYGLCAVGLSTMLMIRMYVLMTALTVLLALLVTRLIQTGDKRLCPLIGLTIFLGLMTQYYFVFYAFFLCASYVLYALVHRNWRGLLRFALWAFAGVGLLVLAFPACLDQLFADHIVSGGSALENLKNTAQYGRRFAHIGDYLRYSGMRAPRYLAMALGAALLLTSPLLVRAAREKKPDLRALWVLLPAYVAGAVVVILSPVNEERYVYNLVPLFVASLSLGIYLLFFALGDFPKAEPVKAGLFLALLVFAVLMARTVQPEYLYTVYRDYDHAVEEYADGPCIYLDRGYHEPLTQDLQQLLFFEDLLVTPSGDEEAVQDYLARYPEAEHCVVFVDINPFWSSGYDPDQVLPVLLEHTDFQSSEMLYWNYLSKVYVLSK